MRADELAALEFFTGCAAEALVPVAAQLRPLTAEPGQVLMRQGEHAVSFLLIGSGRAHVTHTAPDSHVTEADIGPGLIVGEIALLRNATRTATVVATEQLTGWIGGEDAFAEILEIPCMADKLVRIARQRLAAFIDPIAVTVRDGTSLFLRPALPGDVERATNGQVEYSSETMYRRFQSARRPTRALMAYLFEVDYTEHFVWVVTDGVDGPVVADGRFVRDEKDSATAEVAFTVADVYQGRGIGTLLMGALTVSARYEGVTRFTARVLIDNYPMRRIMDRFGAAWVRDDLGVVVTEIDVPPIEDLYFTPDLAARMRDVTRQVIRAVG